MWFLFCIVGYALLSLVLVLDKVILTKSVGRPVVYTFYSTIFLLASFAAWPFGVVWPNVVDVFIAMLSGVTFGVAMWMMFVAIKHSEASHINPFIGALITLCTLGLSYIFLGERLTAMQIAGVSLLVFASLVLSFEKSKQHQGFHAGFLWGIGSAVIFAISHVAAKHMYEHYNFITGLVWTRGTAGLFGVVLLLVPVVRHALTRRGHKKHFKTYGREHAPTIVIVNKVVSVVGIILVHYAIAIGSVTKVNAMAGLQYAMMFLMVYLATKLAPKVFQEYFTTKELIVEIGGLCLVAIGSVMLVL